MIRMFLKISLIVLVALVVSIVVGYKLLEYHCSEDLRERIFVTQSGSIKMAKQRIESVPPEKMHIALQELKKSFQYPISLIEKGEVALSKVEKEQLNAGRNALVIGRSGESGEVIFVPLANRSSILKLGPLPPFPAFNAQLYTSFLICIVSIVFIAVIVMLFPVVRQLRKLDNAAGLIANGELEARAKVTSRDAVGNLAERFNMMASRIQKLVGNQRHLLEAVSHELRTPTSRIQFGIDMLATDQTQEEKEKRIDSINEDLDELDNLIEELLTYVHFDSGSPRLDKQLVLVEEVISELVDRESTAAVSVEILADEDTGCTVLADPKYFVRAIHNLLINAIGFAVDRVAIRLSKNRDSVIVEVWDDGPGVPPQEREQIFEPFARVEASRSRKFGGAGLGLAIVRKIVDWHGGTVEVSDSQDGGAKFRTTWPIAAETSI